MADVVKNGNTKEHFLYYPEKQELYDYGAYYFKIFFVPSYNTEANNSLEQTRQLQETVKVLAKGSQKYSTFSGMYNLLIGDALQRVFVDTAALKQFIDNASNMGETLLSVNNLYANQAKEIAHILLPFNKHSVRRFSGVIEGGAEGVYKNYMQFIAKKALETQMARNEGLQDMIMKGQGAFINKMLGHSMSNIQFETYDLEWDLLARNQDELDQIKQILVFFNAATVSGVNLNDRQNLFYILPPHIEMGVLVTDKSKPDTNTELSSLFGDAATFETTSGKARFLKPKMLYYITSINMDLGDPNANGVFLAPGGDPMNVKLQVRLVKVNFTTVADLFRKDDNSGVGFNADGQREDKDFDDKKEPKNASPFV